jgi:hypothetical protein
MAQDRNALIAVGRKAVLDFLKDAAGSEHPVPDDLDLTKTKSGQRWFAIREAKGNSSEPILMGMDEDVLIALGEMETAPDRANALAASGAADRIRKDLSQLVPYGIKDSFTISFHGDGLVIRA